jgi:hypothetical protein
MPELETLRLVDCHHAHGVLGRLGWTRILGGAGREDVAAQPPQQRRMVDVLRFELRAQVAEETLRRSRWR